MSQKTNPQIRLASRPEGRPAAKNFNSTEEALPELADGEVLVRVIYLSLDPAIRGWMDDRRSYLPPIGIGEVMRGLTAGMVEASKHDDFAVGDHVTGTCGWQRYAAMPGKELQKVPAKLPLTLAMGPLGMTGMTAYFGLFDVAEPKAGETVLVSGAAGAVGSMVGQFAKIHGCRAVGIAGSDEKCEWITGELGFDAAFNYKTAAKTPDGLGDAIRQHCPKGVDVYFDNVGGDILDAALANINLRGRVSLCGAISQYNAVEPVRGPSNYLALLIQRARMEGFIILDYVKRFPEAQAKVMGWIQEGKIAHREQIVDGLENASEAFLGLFDGKNTGKLLVRVSTEG